MGHKRHKNGQIGTTIWVKLPWTDIFPKNCHFFLNFESCFQALFSVLPYVQIPGELVRFFFFFYCGCFLEVITQIYWKGEKWEMLNFLRFCLSVCKMSNLSPGVDRPQSQLDSYLTAKLDWLTRRGMMAIVSHHWVLIWLRRSCQESSLHYWQYVANYGSSIYWY